MEASDYLYVYGTLMQPFDTAMNRFLKANSRFRGTATVRGRLYDLGRYPGLVPDEATGRPVTGHLYQLRNPAKVLAVLDHYEGYDPVRPAAGEYRRERIRLTIEGEVLECWVYLYNADPDRLPEITSENYVDYVKQNPVHQDFINSI